MAELQPYDKLPALSSAVLLLVGSDGGLQQRLAEAILREKKNFNTSIHLATSLPLPPERDHLRPRIDLVAFMIDIKSKYSLKNVEASLAYVDDSFFLGKVCFLVTGVGRVNYCSVEMNAIRNLGEVYCSPVLFCELEVEGSQVATAQRLLRMLETFKEKGSIYQAQDDPSNPASGADQR